MQSGGGGAPAWTRLARGGGGRGAPGLTGRRARDSAGLGGAGRGAGGAGLEDRNQRDGPARRAGGGRRGGRDSDCSIPHPPPGGGSPHAPVSLPGGGGGGGSGRPRGGVFSWWGRGVGTAGSLLGVGGGGWGCGYPPRPPSPPRPASNPRPPPAASAAPPGGQGWEGHACAETGPTRTRVRPSPLPVKQTHTPPGRDTGLGGGGAVGHPRAWGHAWGIPPPPLSHTAPSPTRGVPGVPPGGGGRRCIVVPLPPPRASVTTLGCSRGPTRVQSPPW